MFCVRKELVLCFSRYVIMKNKIINIEEAKIIMDFFDNSFHKATDYNCLPISVRNIKLGYSVNNMKKNN